MPQTFTRTELIRFASEAFIAVGLPAADAQAVATLMIEADLVGADAHGIFRLPQYIRRIEGGAVNRTPAIQVRRTAPATARWMGTMAWATWWSPARPRRQ